MSGVLRLIQNELIKVTRQTSWRVMAIILTVIVIGYPILVNIMNNLYSGYSAMDYEKAAAEAESEIMREYYQTMADTDKYFKDKGFTRENWQCARFYYPYDKACLNVRALELIAEEGKSIYEVLSVFYVDGISRGYYNGELSDKFTYCYSAIDPDTGEEIYEEKDFNAEMAAELLAEFREEKISIEKQIDTPFSEYIKSNFSFNEEEIKTEYEAAKTEYEQNPEKLNEYDAARLRYECAQKLSGAIKKLLTRVNGLSGQEELTYIRLLERFSMYLNYEPDSLAVIPEKEFDQHYYGYYYHGLIYDRYGDYAEAVKYKQEELSRAEDLLAYSIENDMPIDYLTAGSARNALDSALGINMTVLMFFAIFMASVIVSSEHSSGAIRLLLIRPRAKWKILLSKLCCLFIFIASATVFTSVISLVETVIIHGWSDLSVPYLMHSGKEVYEVTPILYYIYKNLIGILPSLLIMLFGLFLSVVTKKSIFALAVALLANVFGSTVSVWLYDVVRTSAQWLKLSPIPYFGLSQCFPDPIGGTMHPISPALYGITMEQGAAVMAVYSLIVTAVTFVIFERQQVKG